MRYLEAPSYVESYLVLYYRQLFGSSSTPLDLSQEAIAPGVAVWFGRYPFHAYNTLDDALEHSTSPDRLAL